MEIKDITEFVHQQYQFVKANQLDRLIVAEERVYPVSDPATASQIRINVTKACTPSFIPSGRLQ